MRVCDVIDEHYDQILADWAAEARRLHEGAHRLRGLALIDHLPELLRNLVEWLRKGGQGRVADYDASAVRHALERLRQDVDLREVVSEYRILRAVVQRYVLLDESGDVTDLVRFNAAIDTAIAEAVAHYSEQRERESPR